MEKHSEKTEALRRNRKRLIRVGSALLSPIRESIMASQQPLAVLIVEDDPIVAVDEVQMVESLGHEVIGVAAETETTFQLADSQLPSIVLLDVNLADGRTGPAICARLTSDYGVPVVFLTADPEQLPPNYAGAMGCIVKPFTVSTLGAALAYVRSYAAEGAAVVPPRGMKMAPSSCATH
jgi:CheY-like chemotaxis protein